MVQQMVTDPNIMFLNVFHKFKPTFSERTWFWLIFGFVGPRQSLDFPRQSLGFPRQSLGFPRVDHAGTTHPIVVFLFLSVVLQMFPICHRPFGRKQFWLLALRQYTGYELSHFFVNCHNKMHLLAEPPCVSKTWQQQWVAGAQRQWSNVVSLNNHGISWQPFRITIGFDIMSSIPSEGPLNSNIYVLNGWITATSAPGGGKVRSVTAKFTLTLRYSLPIPWLPGYIYIIIFGF